ncbi:putative disease resistance RPP13-like protein 1 [Arachis ipaensis]|nr:putative disease resistance RPP13-like protein 1 [Arachis ipaensis]XP_016173946.1 putative disease resistance RPP13-like protein 1 [Arachis ipaensis]XP_020967921.1 putative disease resistance RPP13-like protein 1 [Arachis ipaensis]XP_020967922.1 putative disease resistance RPP13-like protein 1 [Arachis ipaensis]XP_020967923.1 putative disease resistance RPP13-like protein 1 [Arachis ipaensis]
MAAKHERGPYLSSFVDAISKKLSSILEGDSILKDDYSARKSLQKSDDYLCDVEPVLDDAELKQFDNDRVKKWLVDLQDALYMADDLLDELATKAATATPRDQGNSSSWSHYVDSCIEDSGVNVIESTLESLVERKDKLGLNKSAKLDTSWRLPSTSLDSPDIFGRDKDKENIIKLLLDDTCDAESHVTVIPIVGMGGIGKTTLAQLVYNDAKVKEKFDTRVWVCVAENPDLVRLTRTIIGAIDSSPCDQDNFDLLQTNLKGKLTEKTFLVVLDDVWHDQPNMWLWEDFLKPFRCGNNGSKILLTTRDEKVASVFAPNNLHYRLNLLSKEDCWLLFLKHSSVSTNFKQYTNLEIIGRKIVEKCKQLPLAVKTLGGLLRNNYNERDWKNVLDSKIWELSNSKIVSALRVSYHYLPSHLKRCFVYCSLYPQDYEFEKDNLILLWMGEDLLQPKKDKTLKNIGCEDFDELVARSFFQPSSTKRGLFVMHDLMHDLATFFAGKFYFKLEGFKNLQGIDSKIRHLSFSSGSSDITINTYKSFGEACKRAVHLRTALDFTWYEYLESIDVKSIPWLLQQQLRVLSFRIKSLPESIGELIYLRYLNLSEARIVTLPESICKLYNLQTLILRDCYELEMLPSCMQDLVNLQHLDIRGVPRLKEMPKKMSKLKHLNFLSYYIIGEHEENGIRELGTLDNLDGSFDILNLENVKNSDEALEAKMGNKRHINTLKLYWFTGGYMDVETERHILEELQPHENLKELSIEGYRGETFPDWLGLSRYSSMTKLSLQRCKNCCKLPSLGQLPSLQHLEFSELDGLEKIDLAFYNNSGSFEQETPFKCLETLKIEKMAHWREWHFPDEFDGFPELRILSIRNCPVLSGDLPAHLPALEELHIFKCSELVCSLPRAPKIQQLCFGKSRPKRMLEISETQLAQPVLEWVPHLQSLRVEALQILNCHSLISISAYYLPASLTKIHVQGCGSLSSFQLGPLPNLEKLIINECPSMKCVEVPQALPGLRHLCILHCPRLVSLPALGLAAPHLVYLRINDCPEIDCFADECLPASLKTLQVKGCEKLARWITSKGLHSQVRL